VLTKKEFNAKQPERLKGKECMESGSLNQGQSSKKVIMRISLATLVPAYIS
jgi:hypothetical protein